MTDQIILTRKEAREARDTFIKFPDSFPCFWEYKERCDPGGYKMGDICNACKRLTEFAQGGEDE